VRCCIMEGPTVLIGAFEQKVSAHTRSLRMVGFVFAPTKAELPQRISKVYDSDCPILQETVLSKGLSAFYAKGNACRFRSSVQRCQPRAAHRCTNFRSAVSNGNLHN
jgi:hypothetical protein